MCSCYKLTVSFFFIISVSPESLSFKKAQTQEYQLKQIYDNGMLCFGWDNFALLRCRSPCHIRNNTSLQVSFIVIIWSATWNGSVSILGFRQRHFLLVPGCVQRQQDGAVGALGWRQRCCASSDMIPADRTALKVQSERAGSSPSDWTAAFVAPVQRHSDPCRFFETHTVLFCILWTVQLHISVTTVLFIFYCCVFSEETSCCCCLKNVCLGLFSKQVKKWDIKTNSLIFFARKQKL